MLVNGMYFEFPKGKKDRMLRSLYAIFCSFALSVNVSLICFVISNLFVVLLDFGVDIIFFKYIIIFVLLFIILWLILNLIYVFTKKGAFINDDKIVISIGYFERLDIPFKITIKTENIVSINYIQQFNYKDVLKDYKNKNYSWIKLGVFNNNTSVVKITMYNKQIYLLPLENADTFVENITKIV